MNNSLIFSQNLSFDELLNLQTESKKGIDKFLSNKNWEKDNKTEKKWIHKQQSPSIIIDAIFTLQNENCNKNIINFIISDSLVYRALKKSFQKEFCKENSFFSIDSCIEDFQYKDLYIRFFETNVPDEPFFCAIWVFSTKDEWYFNRLNNFCFSRIMNNDYGKPRKFNSDFPGGDKELWKFIDKNMIYPFSASEKGIQGTVYVRFVVEIDGKLSKIAIVKGLSGGFNEEALRIVGMMPDWIPAKREGKPYRSGVLLPIRFRLHH
ncbi:MAG: energy transducer TonB [Bacteroidetes bacterium]|nr:energy transducer TonB [Bacteroidota bacterium]